MAGSLTDVAGLAVGHFTDSRRPTGCTVVLARDGAVCGVDVRGGSPGTRETDLLNPVNTVDRVHAVLLAGGSAFGLDAAGGVMRWLEARGVGVAIERGGGEPVTVPIVPAAILFDLWLGDARIRPDAAAGHAACEAASSGPVAEGNVGAGAGASVGKLFGIERAMKGGLGTASVRVGGTTVAALVAVNAMGDVVDRGGERGAGRDAGRIVAGARTVAGDAHADTMAQLRAGTLPARLQPGTATTLAVVATDAVLTKAEATKVAQMAHDGLARSIEPIHTAGDGDVVFALATGTSGKTAPVTLVGALAADVLADAVLRAVRAASSLPGLPAARDFPAHARHRDHDKTATHDPRPDAPPP